MIQINYIRPFSATSIIVSLEGFMTPYDDYYRTQMKNKSLHKHANLYVGHNTMIVSYFLYKLSYPDTLGSSIFLQLRWLRLSLALKLFLM